MWSRIELNLLYDTARSRALVYMYVCLWAKKKEWNKISKLHAFIQNILWALTDIKNAYIHTSIQTHDLADIFRLGLRYIWWENSYAHTYSNQFKTFRKRMICQDFLPILASLTYTCIWRIMCNSVLNGFCIVRKQWCFSHTVIICRATQSVRRLCQLLWVSVPEIMKIVWNIVPKFVFEHQTEELYDTKINSTNEMLK